MMPVRPPAASASSNTAGNQKRRKMCLRSPGGALTMAVGRYAFSRSNGGFAAIGYLSYCGVLAEFLLDNALDVAFEQRGFPQLDDSARKNKENYSDFKLQAKARET